MVCATAGMGGWRTIVNVYSVACPESSTHSTDCPRHFGQKPVGGRTKSPHVVQRGATRRCSRAPSKKGWVCVSGASSMNDVSGATAVDGMVDVIGSSVEEEGADGDVRGTARDEGDLGVGHLVDGRAPDLLDRLDDVGQADDVRLRQVASMGVH